ncbi:MAG: IS21 family transposase, partial [Candidatus Riflebacteria bacterium]|nr:IS21 family transposase [Candidatus Riflebacteria bacterium]
KAKEILRLKLVNQLSFRKIARACKISKTTVKDYVERAEKANLSVDQIQTLAEDEIQQLLFPESKELLSTRPLPDWEEIYLELKQKGITLQGLWEEYRDQHPDALCYSRIHELYQEFAQTVDTTMRHTHRAGEKLFVDYSGKTIEIINPKTGEICNAEIFVAVLGASNYTYVDATFSQSLPDWIGSHVRALDYFGGVPEVIVPDNLKSGVKKAWYYDPDINPTYQEFAAHYQTAILPARAGKSRDKAKVEVGVQIVQRWILMKLRKQRFFSLGEANKAIRELLEGLNARPFRKLSGSRRSLFEEVDKPALKPLPVQRYEFAIWKKAKINIDYHVEFDHHYYSSHFEMVGKTVEIRATQATIEIFHNSKRIASHPRSFQKGRHTTLEEHMPKNHQFVQWNPQRFLNWGKSLGFHVEKVIEKILNSRPHPEIGYRECLGVFRLGKQVGACRLNAACQRAIHFDSPRLRTVHNILNTGQDKLPLPTHKEEKLPFHENVRGGSYYSNES